MGIHRIADMQQDEAAWKESRRSLLTSSEIFSWLGDTPSWWSDGPEDVLAGKQGVEKVFDRETETTIAHGSFDEGNIIEKFGTAAGCLVMPENGLYVNDRFPGIGASVDGFGKPDHTLEPQAVFGQDRTLFPYLNDLINSRDTEFLLECKKSLSSKWQQRVPEYYVTQVQTQLAVMELDYAIIFAETVKKGDDQKWRLFHDFRAYVIERDPAWEKVLLEQGERFLDKLKEIS